MIITKLSKRDFENILNNYNIGRYRSSRHIPRALGNTVYILITTHGKFILKIYEYACINYILSQLRIKEFLEKKGAPIVKIIKTNDKKSLFRYNNKRITIERFIEGEHPGKLSKRLTKNAALTLAALHRDLMPFRQKMSDQWIKDHQFKPIKHMPETVDGFDFRKQESTLMTSSAP